MKVCPIIISQFRSRQNNAQIGDASVSDDIGPVLRTRAFGIIPVVGLRYPARTGEVLPSVAILNYVAYWPSARAGLDSDLARALPVNIRQKRWTGKRQN